MAAPASPAWYWNRLRLMSPAELLYRLRRGAWVKLNRRGIGMLGRVPPARLDRFGAALCDVLPPLQSPHGLVAAANAILDGRWDIFALRDADLGFPPDWNVDPLTRMRSPMGFGKTIDYRDERVVGNSKYLWEPARHLELTVLAQAWALSRERRYLDGCATLLRSWLDAAPYPFGPHWTSSLELAIRLLNWSFTWHLVGGLASPLFEDDAGLALRDRWLESVHRHAHFIGGHLSYHSSANNHILGEYMGLFVAGVTWPCWPEAEVWRARGQEGVVREALAQNFPDGVNREQAIYYQHEVMDMMLLCALIARANGIALPEELLQRLQRLAEFVAAIMDVDGHVPMIGDADDARMVCMSHEPQWCPYRSLLASCALLFGRPDFKCRAGALDDKTRWLFGPASQARWDALPEAAAPPRLAFPEGGYYLLGTRFGEADEVRIVADAAPLGYLSIAAHGHADALAFTLSSQGEEVLIDPGTFAYHTLKTWRDYFKGTRAHNTVCVDDADQSENGGNFMWLRKANSRLLRHEPQAPLQVFEAEHDGYARLSDPVLHRRRIEFDAATRSLCVIDTLECRGEHDVALHWHLGETINATPDEDGAWLQGQRVRARLQVTATGFTGRLARGEEAPILGWVSRRFDEKLPCSVLQWRGRIQGTRTLVTRVRLLPVG
jgi:hypothetical protein